jgi:hypothetical protein
MSDNGFETAWRPALRGALLFIAYTLLSRITYEMKLDHIIAKNS